MSKFKIGDRVTAVNPGTFLTKGATYTVSGFYYRSRTDMLTIEGKPDGFYDWRFVLADEEPEVGDTVEVLTEDGTTVRGVVSELGSLGGLFFSGGNAYVSATGTQSVKILKKVKKPKVWAVGDVVEGDDYASESILPGRSEERRVGKECPV